MSIPVPDDEAILPLHKRIAPNEGALELVYTHCLIVRGIAEQLRASSGADVDVELVRAGCLLHDVGVYRLYDDTGTLDRPNYIRHWESD